MVANLSSHKAGWDARWKEFSDWADKGQAVMTKLLALVDEDTAAFDKIMAAIGMPSGFPGGSDGKESACQCRRCGFDPWVRKIPWRRK